MLPQVSTEFSLGITQMGTLIAFQFAGFTVFTVTAGMVSDRIGKKPVTAAALIILALSCFLISLVRSYEMVCVLLIFIGGGLGIAEAMSNALLSDAVPDNAVFQLNFLQVIFGLGAIIGPILAGVAFSNGVSWRVVYVVLSCFTAILTLFFVTNKIPGLPPQDRIDMQGLKHLIFDKKFLLICLCMFLYTGSESSAWGWMTTYTETVLDFSVFKSSLAVAVFWLAVTVTRLFISLSIKKFDILKLVMILAVCSGITCAIMGVLRNENATWIIIVLLGIACSSQWGLIVTYGTRIYNRNSGTVFSVLMASGSIGMTTVPYMMGIVASTSGSMRFSLAVPAIMFVSISAIFLVFLKNKKLKVES